MSLSAKSTLQLLLKNKPYYVASLVQNNILTNGSFSSHNSYSTDVNFLSKPEYTNVKKGKGGRSSFSGIVATVFGASGFVGRYVCNRLGKIGTQLIIPYRGDPYNVNHLKVCGDLGQVLFHPFHLNDEDSIRKAVQYSNVVINLIGRDWETHNFNFKQVHVDGAERIARICREMGVDVLLHMSALNSDVQHQGYFMSGGSKFLKTKGQSEEVVKAFFPDAIIFRPSDIFGQEDRFLRYFCGHWRRHGQGLIPLPHAGVGIFKQPVFVGDVAQGIVNAIKDRNARGKTFEIVGPRQYELSELIDYFFRVMRRTEENVGYKRYDMKWDLAFRMKEAVTDTVHGLPSLEDLRVNLTVLEDRIKWELKIFLADSYYEEELGEFAPPAPPKYISAS